MSSADATIVISGVGVITCLGVGVDSLWEAMLEGRSGLKRIERFDPSGFASQVAGELAEDEFKVRKIVPKSHRKATKVMCRDTELAVGAAADAVENARIITAGTSDEPPTIDPSRVGCHIGAGLISAEVNELGSAPSQVKKKMGRSTLHIGAEKACKTSRRFGYSSICRICSLVMSPSCMIAVDHPTPLRVAKLQVVYQSLNHGVSFNGETPTRVFLEALKIASTRLHSTVNIAPTGLQKPMAVVT